MPKTRAWNLKPLDMDLKLPKGTANLMVRVEFPNQALSVKCRISFLIELFSLNFAEFPFGIDNDWKASLSGSWPEK